MALIAFWGSDMPLRNYLFFCCVLLIDFSVVFPFLIVSSLMCVFCLYWNLINGDCMQLWSTLRGHEQRRACLNASPAISRDFPGGPSPANRG